MQGVNVVARPLDANGNPLYQYTVTAVTGALFSGNHGNPITGFSDASGNPLTMWGSNDPTLQGSFDLSGIPLPPGMTLRQLPNHIRGHRSALHSRKLRRPLHPGSGRAFRDIQLHHASQSLRGKHADPQRHRLRLSRGRIQRCHRPLSPSRVPCPPAACGAGA